jgi:DNA repair protein SbcD/Mre11
MKILHTSDWHLGRSLHKNKRYDEFESFLDWLYQIIIDENIDHVLVAGDIFDNTTPSNRAQELYYKFLCKTASVCQNIVIIAGNHDSPTFLNAPRDMLKYLNIHVVGAVTDDLNDEVLVLGSEGGNSLPLIVCAVPYLRDRDIRKSEAGEAIEEKELKLLAGIKTHYSKVCEFALQKKREIGGDVPIIAMGHLYTQGGKTSDGDGVRELYVGTLGHISRDIFPDYLDYVALGHLHVPQKVNGCDNICYSGSPIAMGFGEGGQQKKIKIIEFNNSEKSIYEKPVPKFRVLKKISGDIDKIKEGITELRSIALQAWVEVEYKGDELISGIRQLLEIEAEGTGISIHNIKDRRRKTSIVDSIETAETLDELTVDEVFNKCLETNNIPSEQHSELAGAYKEILNHIYELDWNAE